jgi:hypothetical protein
MPLRAPSPGGVKNHLLDKKKD